MAGLCRRLGCQRRWHLRCKSLNDPALRDLAATALSYDMPQLVGQLRQIRNLLLDMRKVLTHKLIYGRAVRATPIDHLEQITDRFERKPKLTAASHETGLADKISTVRAMVSSRARQQPDALAIADRLHLDRRCLASSPLVKSCFDHLLTL